MDQGVTRPDSDALSEQRAVSSAGERSLHTGEAAGSIPAPPTTPCKVWTGKRTKGGYGYWNVPDGIVYAHRDAWEKANGRPVPPGMMVCHSCDNPPCCADDHLWLGTQLDNMRDCKAKGRPHGRPFRFTVEQMRAIAAEQGTVATIAKRHGIGKDSVYRWRKQFGDRS